MTVNYTEWRANRLSLVLHGCPDPGPFVVAHECDNSRCVRPSHLRVDTQANNIQAKVARNRQARGEKIGRSKLTAEQVAEIRTRYAAGNTSYRALVSFFGVHNTQISNIVNHKQWAT